MTSATAATPPGATTYVLDSNPLERLDIQDIDTITDWHERFFLYIDTHPHIDPTKQTSHYLSMIGKVAYRLLKDLAYPDLLSSLTVSKMQDLLEKHLQPRNFEVSEREKFHTMQKKTDESHKTIILRVQRQASKCSFGTNLELQLRDRLVAGVTDPELKRKLVKESKLDLQMAKQLLEDWDAVNNVVHNSTQAFATSKSRKPWTSQPKPFKPPQQQRPSFTQRGATSRPNRFQPRPTPPSHQSETKPYYSKPSSTNGLCDSCGGPHLRKLCRFRQATCNFCNKQGHLQRVCKVKQSKHVAAHNVAIQNDSEPEEFPAFTVQPSNNDHYLHQNLTFTNGKQLSFIVDTGSPVTFLPLHSFQELGFQTSSLSKSSSTLKGISGHELPVVGKFTTRVQTQSHESDVTFIVAKDGPSVLGLDGLRSLNVDVILNVNIDSEITKLIAQCNNNKGGMKIDPVKLQCSGQPVFAKARSIPYGLRQPVKKILDDLVNDGILQPVASSAWASPIVTPLKPNGLPRVCGDFRFVNQQLRQASMTTPDIEDMFQGLEGNKLFSKIDLSNAFLQVPLHESSYEITTINTPWGLYQHRFLPFGLHVSPGFFQKTIDRILHGLSGTRAYQDDIIIYGTDKEEHDRNLLAVLKSLNDHNVTINAKKSDFNMHEIKYLGYVINGDGISPDNDRIKALQLAPKPQSSEQLQSFLGFAQYYSRFVPNFSVLTQPLYQLIPDFQWSQAADKQYDKVINALIHGKVLTSYKLGAQTSLVVDASEHALGAVLEQNGKPVTCISRKLSASELHYSQTQKEALAVHWAVQRLHKFLFGIHFQIITDHRALEFIFNPDSSHNKATSSMLQRWALELTGYQYTISHRPGKEIPQADYLSRHAYASDQVEPTDINLVNPLPISRNVIIEETKSAYGSIVAALRNGWSYTARRKFPKLYALRNDLQLQADGTITFHDRLLIPPICRKDMLTHLHLSHLGRDKMLSLARLLCWWPSINQDVKTFVNDCQACSRKPRSHKNWSPWPIPYRPMQRLHADYCGPFLGTYWALIVEDAYSKFPEVFLTRHATADFTQLALQKIFAREGIPLALVTDNGPHFSATALQNWLRSLGCTPIFTPPRHPKSNGLAENFVRTLKTAVTATNPTTYTELDRSIDTFLLQYRNATHASTKKAPAVLFKGRTLRCSNSTDTSDVWFLRGNNNRPCEGIVLSRSGQRLLTILDKSDGSVHRRHVEQITFSPPTTPVASPTTHPSSLPTTSPLPSHTDLLHSNSNSSNLPVTDVPEPTSPVSLIPTPPTPVPGPSAARSDNTPVPVRRSTRLRTRPQRFRDFILDGEESVTAEL